MVRTQIQLTEEQAGGLKRLSLAQHISVAELIRQCVERYLQRPREADPKLLRKRALALAGKFNSGCKDLAANHDKYLAEIYSK